MPWQESKLNMAAKGLSYGIGHRRRHGDPIMRTSKGTRASRAVSNSGATKASKANRWALAGDRAPRATRATSPRESKTRADRARAGADPRRRDKDEHQH